MFRPQSFLILRCERDAELEYDSYRNSLEILFSRGIEHNGSIYKLLGVREVASLIKSWQEPGHYNITWNSQDDHKVMVSSGIYFYYLEAQEFKQIKKMILLK